METTKMPETIRVVWGTNEKTGVDKPGQMVLNVKDLSVKQGNELFKVMFCES